MLATVYYEYWLLFNFFSKDVDVLKPLLENTMKCSPQTATKILKVAKYLADLMHKISIKDGVSEENLTCPGIEYLVHLGTILAKAVAGYQDVDNTNCAWNELPIIPTEEEICSSNAIHLDTAGVFIYKNVYSNALFDLENRVLLFFSLTYGAS